MIITRYILTLMSEIRFHREGEQKSCKVLTRLQKACNFPKVKYGQQVKKYITSGRTGETQHQLHYLAQHFAGLEIGFKIYDRAVS